ncbi:ABC-type transport system involved in multi-copper enzyme maturation, permease component [Sphaerochaeta pleomorpha str. Grapes]|uniref:ABC-type transport system involved in multi-copper enzyme maturation, permease component n=1 Tax=Sphaerochaeta pleomorpha (strain ATCC BAA-1885 / DSM 22778 / Grapes) TaxID=158190 RepID=G8QTB4_SPHPG|nr:ABC transporter permease [Sphaerochaeta pleomorpha]AEV29081.1 ABC-type transport system involved in multi-copper enzyme maturation, permease component [Sphaerochaeta pleomorpha str. Grapes]
MKQREGSALTGLSVVFYKELQDFTGSVRMVVLTILILLTAGASMYVATETLRSLVGEDSFLLLGLFTIAKDPIPSFLSFMSFLVPLTGIALGFDTINGEFQNRTLGRVLSQPIYRDVLLFGKALGALVAMAIILLALWLLVIGSAMLFLGVPPSGEQIARALVFYLITVLYGTLWFVISMFCSIICRQNATSALVAIAIWLFSLVFWPMLSQLLSQAIGGNGSLLAAKLNIVLSRLSPYTLYCESSIAILNPTTRSLGVVLFSQIQGAMLGSPLPFGQSLLLIWPQMTSFFASILLFFTGGYVLFQRREIRM